MKQYKILLVFTIVILFASCGKGSHEETESYTSEDRKMSPSSYEKKDMPSAEAVEERAEPLLQSKDNSIGPVFLPIQNNQERLLEFQIDLGYQTLDLIKTRKDLLSFITKYGFIESSSAVNSDSPYMNVKIRIKAEKLYEALLELDTYGTLLNENISTIDHTEGMVWEKIKTTREKIRVKRRTIANNQTTSNSKNWESIEEAISSSEDGLDQSELQIWKINDRVKWATLNLSFSVPTPSDKIIVPEYRNALVGITNLFLEFTYLLVWMIPVFLVVGLLYVPSKKLVQWVRQKKI
ncbi:PF14257 domain protein [Leptospira yanagawae serovar Saopaulo str. Sao Paulo = ATCC 700523]|uniref:PF14257 domain protein n=1 Tax=Leptospira yanagawae serovar Saopaulo str. Sao Paulo = ATCC 700523 TaxID=1249483 RepID=A0A5E8HC53_9LEPT|nr:DUF4349 domain-containing protein [Leptospira yanagawae]EOQ88794.1 PF14257 domain protein [Leptospira yanagawae serovar Saopaulo str. Sao Paulo = ATCC 700523]